MEYSLFPNLPEETVAYFRNNVPSFQSIDWSGRFTALVNGKQLTVPIRIYNIAGYFEILDENFDYYIPALCLYTRHNNGFIRERALDKLFIANNLKLPIIPYVLKLAEEYVIEIAEKVQRNITIFNEELLKQFLDENPTWLSLMNKRCTSYWDCYYRFKIRNIDDYPGIKLVKYLYKLNG